MSKEQNIIICDHCKEEMRRIFTWDVKGGDVSLFQCPVHKDIKCVFDASTKEGDL